MVNEKRRSLMVKGGTLSLIAFSGCAKVADDAAKKADDVGGKSGAAADDAAEEVDSFDETTTTTRNTEYVADSTESEEEWNDTTTEESGWQEEYEYTTETTESDWEITETTQSDWEITTESTELDWEYTTETAESDWEYTTETTGENTSEAIYSGEESLDLNAGYYRSYSFSLERSATLEYVATVFDGPHIDVILTDPTNYRYYKNGDEWRYYSRASRFNTSYATTKIKLRAGDYVFIIDNTTAGSATPKDSSGNGRVVGQLDYSVY